MKRGIGVLKKQGGLKLKIKQPKKGPPSCKKPQQIPSRNPIKQTSSSPSFQSLEDKIASITSKASNDDEKNIKSIDNKTNDESDVDNADDPWASLFSDAETSELLQMSDTLLALRSLVQKYAAAYFMPFVLDDKCGDKQDTSIMRQGYPFVLRQMLHQVLLSQSKSNTVNAHNVLTYNQSNSFTIHNDSSNTAQEYDNHAEAATMVMKEISTLQQENKIRLLKLPTSPLSSMQQEEDIAIIETFVYIQSIQQAIEMYNTTTTEKNSSDPNILPSILAKFISLLPTETRMTISHTKLLQSFPSSHIDILIQKRFLVPSHDRDNPGYISSLSSSSSCTSFYYFTLPSLGKAVQQINRGRQNILQRLKMSYRKEIPKKVLLDKGMNPNTVSALPMSFHLRDLQSLGKIAFMERPSGVFVKLLEHRQN